MNLNAACTNILDQLEEVVVQIKESDFSKPIATLSHSTLGQHLRHTLEFFICLQQGVDTGMINYDKRAHDKLIEQDKFIALSTIGKIKDFVRNQKEDSVLKLEVGYDPASDECVSIHTNFSRELVYNIEHAVHHMALIKIGINEGAAYVKLPDGFGIAASTIRFRESIESSR